MTILRSLVLKRALDLAGALGGLLVLALPMACIALAIRTTMGSPVLFRSVRPGLRGRPFTLYKFRTMRGSGEPRSDKKRLTRLGRVLRSWSLDELPSLWNVLKGDMSLVGPRPLLIEYLDRYTPDQSRRHDVRPGLTGLAQVSGRNAQTWEARFAFDLWYVDNRSLILDFRILARTAWRVLAREGISAPGHATMPVFRGTADPGGSGTSEREL